MYKILFTATMVITFFLSNSNFSMAYDKEIKGISSTLAENIAKAGKKMIAVVDFTDLQGNVTELGRFLAEEFSVAFAGAGKGFEVVDRTHLKSILAEHKLSTTGMIDPQTSRKLGQVAGVDALITGTITPFGDSIRLSVKILDTATAKVIGASSGDIAKTKAIEELLARGIETGTPSQHVMGRPDQTQTERSQTKTGKLYQNIEVLWVELDSLQMLGEGEVVVNLTFINNNKWKGGAAVAFNRVKYGTWDMNFLFKPRDAKTFLTDNKGSKYIYDSSMGIGFAESETDWTKIKPGERITSSITFKKERDRKSMGSVFTLNCEIYVAWRDESKEMQIKLFNIFLKDIKPNPQ